MVRFRKGTKVEAFSTEKVPSGAWCPAEILDGNGHTYNVRYDGHGILERVRRKAIRPCPPQQTVAWNWIPGDVVEVFDNFSWKMAEVSKVVGEKHLFARLVGSSREVKVSKFAARVRLSWQNHQWVVIGKVCGNSEDEKPYKKLILKYSQNSRTGQHTYTRTSLHVKDPLGTKINIQESPIVSSRTLKRESTYNVKASTGAAKKSRAIEKEGGCYRLSAANSCVYPKKVDEVVYTQEMLHEKHINASYSRTGFSGMDAERRIQQTGVFGYSCAIDLKSNDANSPTCSVGSCSISSNNSYRVSHSFRACPIEDIDGQYSDAESFCHLAYEEGNAILPKKKDLAAEIHRLELHAYRCTMEALHSSGPLSWEQEALVTDLRLSLHISNDEHLMELRNLGSYVTSIPTS